MRNYFPKRTSGAPFHMSKSYYVPVGFVTPSPFEVVYCYICCRRRRVADARYRMIFLVFMLGLFTALYRSFLERCSLTNKAIWTIWQALPKPHQRRQGPDPHPLWLLFMTPSAPRHGLAYSLRSHFKPQSDIRCNRFVTSPRLTIAEVATRSPIGPGEVAEKSATDRGPRCDQISRRQVPAKSTTSPRSVAD